MKKVCSLKLLNSFAFVRWSATGGFLFVHCEKIVQHLLFISHVLWPPHSRFVSAYEPNNVSKSFGVFFWAANPDLSVRVWNFKSVEFLRVQTESHIPYSGMNQTEVIRRKSRRIECWAENAKFSFTECVDFLVRECQSSKMLSHKKLPLHNVRDIRSYSNYLIISMPLGKAGISSFKPLHFKKLNLSQSAS